MRALRWLLVGLAWAASVEAASRDFETLLSRLDATYLAPSRLDAETLRREAPTTLAVLLGHALKAQAAQLQQRPALAPRFEQLQVETQRYLEESVRRYGGSPAYVDLSGRPLTSLALWSVVANAFQGGFDDVVARDYRVTPAPQPSVFNAGAPPFRQDTAGLPLVQDEPPPAPAPDELRLLGVAPPSGPMPPRAARESGTARPDDVLGTWYGADLGPNTTPMLVVTREGADYVGRHTQRAGYGTGWPRRGEVCFKVHSLAQAQADRVTFDGQELSYDRWGPFTASFSLDDSGAQVLCVDARGGQCFKSFRRQPWRLPGGGP